MNIDKQALRQIAESVDREEWDVLDNGDADYQVIVSGSLERGATYRSYQPVTNEISNKKIAAFIAAFNPKVALALLDDLDVKEEQRANWFQMAQKLGEDLDAAEKRNAEQREYYEGVIADGSKRIAELEKGHQEAAKQINSWRRLAKQNIAERGKDISELEAALQRIAEQSAIVAAAEKLVRCKGRYHSELNYRALAKLFGVITPDLPPLVHENVHYADAADVEITALRQRIAELEAKLETADKLQDSAFRDGLKAGFSYGQTDDQSGYEQCLKSYSSRGKDNG
ncbi:protein Ead [Salmonella enterica]|nr:protein Ead [Salmonella enterica]EBD3886660.1 protein Ead [Salmonella enterica]